MIGGWPLMTGPGRFPGNPATSSDHSMDTLRPQLAHLSTGDVQVLLNQQYFYFGRQCVDILVEKVTHGKAPEKVIDFAPLVLSHKRKRGRLREKLGSLVVIGFDRINEIVSRNCRGSPTSFRSRPRPMSRPAGGEWRRQKHAGKAAGRNGSS